MKRLTWPGLILLALTACASDNTALVTGDAGAGGTGGADNSSGGSGGPIRGRTDGSIVDPGTGGTGGSTGGSSGSTGGTAGTDAGAPKKDAQPATDADVLCTDTCSSLAQAYGDAIKQELACDPTAPGQCLKATQSALTCGCTIWVNSTVLSDAVRKKFDEAGCQRCIRFTACPAIACIPPPAALCTPVSAQADRPIVAPPAAKGQCMSKH